MKKNNNKKNFKILFSISIFILITAIIIIFFLFNKKNNQITNIPIEVIPTPTTTPIVLKELSNPNKHYTPTEIIDLFKSTLQISCASEEITSGRRTQWLSKKNDYSTASILTGININLTATLDYKYFCKYGNYPDISSITVDSLKTVQATIDDFFQSNGFVKDENNSIEYYSDDSKIIDTLVIGYRQLDTKCLVSLYSRTDPFSDIFCGTINKEKTSWFRQLYPIINPKNNPENRIDVEQLIGKYANGGMNPPIGGGGAEWFAVKINDKWKIVWGGQELIPCQIVKKYNIPKEIYEDNCYSDYPQEYFSKYLNL